MQAALSPHELIKDSTRDKEPHQHTLRQSTNTITNTSATIATNSTVVVVAVVAVVIVAVVVTVVAVVSRSRVDISAVEENLEVCLRNRIPVIGVVAVFRTTNWTRNSISVRTLRGAV